MIHAMVRVNLSPGRLAEALNILHSVAGRIRTKAGCISCYVYQDTEKKHVIMLEDLWRDEDKMVQHLRSPEYQNVLIVMEMALDKKNNLIYKHSQIVSECAHSHGDGAVCAGYQVHHHCKLYRR